MPASVRRLSAAVGWLVLAAAGLAVGLWPAPDSRATPTDRHFRVGASQFAFTPSILVANPGDRVTIDVVATDVEHGLFLDGYGLSVVAEPGQTAHLTFVANRSGTFRFRCSVTCGALHPFMIGTLNVGANWLLVRSVGLFLLAAIAGVWVARRPAPGGWGRL